MNVCEIDNILNNFFENRNSNALLIDGPWGCGKTYQINEIIKEKKNKYDIYYISLFGLESIDEINTKLYFKIHKIRKHSKIFKNALFMVSKAIPIIRELNITDALDNQLGTFDKKIKKKSIIVFDDLERLSSAVSYDNLLGYINGLFMSGCRIICLSNSKKIQADRLELYNDFKEKVFDHIYTINDINTKLFDKIFSPEKNEKENTYLKNKIDNIESYYYLFDNNLRLAKKVYYFFRDEIIPLYESKEHLNDKKVYNLNDLFEATIHTVKIALSNNTKSINEGTQGKIILYKQNDLDKMKFDENIVLGLYNNFIIEQSKSYEKIRLEKIILLVRTLLMKFCFYESDELEELLFQKADEKYAILNETFFYLSQEKKIKFVDVLEEFIRNEGFKGTSVMTKIRDVINGSNFEFSNDVLRLIAKEYIQSENYGFGIKWHFNLYEPNGVFKNNVNQFIRKLETIIDECYDEQNKEYILKLKNETNYKNKTTILNDIDKNKENLNISKIYDELAINNFFFPNLIEDIDYDKWYYCNMIAIYAKENGKGEDFKKCCISIFNKNPNDETLKDRLTSLLYYNGIDKNFSFDNLNECE